MKPKVQAELRAITSSLHNTFKNKNKEILVTEGFASNVLDSIQEYREHKCRVLVICAEGFDELTRHDPDSEFNAMIKFMEETRPDNILLCLKHGPNAMAQVLADKFHQTSSVLCMNVDVFNSSLQFKETFVKKVQPKIKELLMNNVATFKDKTRSQDEEMYAYYIAPNHDSDELIKSYQKHDKTQNTTPQSLKLLLQQS